MAYDSTTKVITAPVSFYDVQRCLATSKNGLKDFCTHPGINKWSKCKPVINNSIFTAAEPLWWKGDNGKCGLTIPEYSTLAALIAAYDAGAITWPYQQPIGGSSSPFRLTDFKNYFHGATSPLLNWSCSEFGLNLYADSTIGGNMQTRFIDGNDLSIADIANYANWYFGVVITNGTVTRSGSSPTTLVNTGFSAQVPTTGIPIGEYKVYPFISPVPMDQNPTTFIALDGFSKRLVQIYDSQYNVSLLINWNIDYSAVNYTITVENRSALDTLTNVYVMMREDSKAWDATLMQDEVSKTLTNTQVPGNGSVVISGTVTDIDYFAFPSWRFWFIADAGDVKVSTVLRQQSGV